MIRADNITEMDDETFSGSALMELDNEELCSTGLIHNHHTTQILLTTKPPIHVPEAGLNPLVDAASYVFTIMGKLHFTKHYKNLEKLKTELVQEVENFRETIQAYDYDGDYIDEYILISCYSLCSALDNIIANTTWGNQGKWELYSLVDHYKQSSLSHENILIILERLVSEPDVYIDVMEFIYICLNLGLTFKNPSYGSEFSNEQLEQITYSLYKRIRTQRGNYNKTLTPFSLKQIMSQNTRSAPQTSSKWLNVMLLGSVVVALMTGGKFWFDQQVQAVEQPPQIISKIETKDHGRTHELHAHPKKVSRDIIIEGEAAV